MAQPVPGGTQAGWGGPDADTGMTAEERAMDELGRPPAVQPVLLDPAGAAPKALAGGGAPLPGARGGAAAAWALCLWGSMSCCITLKRAAALPHPPSFCAPDEEGGPEEGEAGGLPFTAEAQELLRQAAAIEAAPRPGAVGAAGVAGRAAPAAQHGRKEGQPARSFPQ